MWFLRLVAWLIIAVINLTVPMFAEANEFESITPDNRVENDLEEVIMADSKTKFIPTVEIVRRALMQASGVVADEDRQSFPIPVIQDNEPWIIFLFSPSLAKPKEPTKLYPPGYFLRLNAKTGVFKELLSVTPRNFEQNHSSEEIIGEISMPAGMSFEEFIHQRNRLYELYDMLLPVFFAECEMEDRQLNVSSKEFITLFRLLSEPPLWPYYRAKGSEFFDWIALNEQEK